MTSEKISNVIEHGAFRAVQDVYVAMGLVPHFGEVVGGELHAFVNQ